MPEGVVRVHNHMDPPVGNVKNGTQNTYYVQKVLKIMQKNMGSPQMITTDYIGGGGSEKNQN